MTAGTILHPACAITGQVLVIVQETPVLVFVRAVRVELLCQLLILGWQIVVPEPAQPILPVSDHIVVASQAVECAASAALQVALAVAVAAFVVVAVAVAVEPVASAVAMVVVAVGKIKIVESYY